MKNLYPLISDCDERKGLKNQEVLSLIIPFLKHLIDLHERGLVFDWHSDNSFLQSDKSILFNPNAYHLISKNPIKLFGVKTKNTSKFNIQSEFKEKIDGNNTETQISNSKIQLDPNSKITKPVYLLNYISYEEKLDYRDPKTDIFMFGLLLASLVIGVDLRKEYDLEYFVTYHNELHKLKLDIHPVFAHVITESTDLNRKKRSKDISEILVKLENYQTYNPENSKDLTRSSHFKSLDISNRKDWILTELKSRLFDLSKRNKLLYYKPSMKFVNLTQSSFPVLLDYKIINPNLLFTYSPKIVKKLKVDADISLNEYLQFRDLPFLVGQLNKVRSEARKDIQEFGFSQLKLVPLFLKWYNLKEDKNTQINSPLLLIPVEIRKKKGLKDHYIINSTSDQAQINPLLAFYLKELYDIDLPDFIDNNYDAIVDLHKHLEHQISLNNSGVKLEFQNKPKLQFLHKQINKSLSLYKKRSKSRKSKVSKIEYSYDPKSYNPKGIQLYKSKVFPEPHILEYTINPDLKSSYLKADKRKEKTFYSADQSQGITPYNWGFDLCDVVLGNFNYKKMTLVRDYNEILKDNLDSPIFETLFSDEPKSQYVDLPKSDYSNEIVSIINADESQARAVALSQNPEGPDSFIIQGPPGTGKSQTITNLIANAVANHKNVLFVCEKRAAIDVVFHRLKQKKLGDFCAQIHDSQTDKKAFIHNLRDIYNSQISSEFDLASINERRNKAIDKVQHLLKDIKNYHEIMSSKQDHAGVSFRELINILLESENQSIESLKSEIPEYKQWENHKTTIIELYELLAKLDYNTFSDHSLSLLNLKMYNQIDVQTKIPKSLKDLNTAIHVLKENLDSIEFSKNKSFILSEILQILKEAKKISLLLNKPSNINLLNTQNSEFINFSRQLNSWIEKNENLEKTQEENSFWLNKFDPLDARSALESSKGYEQNFLSFLFPGYWKLKSVMKENYNFSKHKIKPKLSTILENLCHEYDLLHDKEKLKKKSDSIYGFEDLSALDNLLKEIHSEIGNSEFIKDIQNSNSVTQTIENILELENPLSILNNDLKKVTFGYQNKTLNDTLEHLKKASEGLIHLPTLAPVLKEFSKMDGSFKHWIADHPLSIKQIKTLTALKSTQIIYENNLWFKSMNFIEFKRKLKQLKQAYSDLLDLNTAYIQIKVKSEFKTNIAWSEMKNKEDSIEEKNLKKEYKTGRKIIEHEFSKKMRYKSIRDLITKESSEIIRDLKPIWMMSPLSVADTLPIDSNLFDLVIFDEASQINLEEGISPIFRGKKTIVVGDQMQMPPTNFFSSNINQVTNEESEDELYRVHLDADSLLSQSDRKMPSILLNWHYRSKREALISFSNAAFYNRKLNTIPDVDSYVQNHKKIESNPDFTDFNALNFLERSISYHKLNDSPYAERSNEGEARYISKMVQYLMKSHPNKTIGVVAFSQQQQQTIETALDELATENSDFEKALEEEFQRTEEGQFVGLFVKNLENVQGDERDIMILSICYGYNTKNKMYMNFGPINRTGGEKRLNVIFSRAKQHMAIVSSIYHTDITNEYNEGALYFKRYLQYAQAISEGQNETAQSVLNTLSTIEIDTGNENSILIQQIKFEIEKRGYFTKVNVGHSGFTCDLGIKKHGSDKQYSLGICVDTMSFYNTNNIHEQYIHKPNILNAFGWTIKSIYSKEWLENKEKCLDEIVQKLENKSNE